MSQNNPDLNHGETLIENKTDPEEKVFEVPTTSATTSDTPNFGWSDYAERMNGRFAMVGFLAIIVIEIVSNKTFINWAGF